jgi:hypothetical protein
VIYAEFVLKYARIGVFPAQFGVYDILRNIPWHSESGGHGLCRFLRFGMCFVTSTSGRLHWRKQGKVAVTQKQIFVRHFSRTSIFFTCIRILLKYQRGKKENESGWAYADNGGETASRRAL